MLVVTLPNVEGAQNVALLHMLWYSGIRVGNRDGFGESFLFFIERERSQESTMHGNGRVGVGESVSI